MTGQRSAASDGPLHFFESVAAFEAWLETNHASVSVLSVGFHKLATGRQSITYPEAVDVALCFGWIDGVRRRIDEESYSVRFTPRKRGSIWSAFNIGRVEHLSACGRMRPSGLEVFASRREGRSGLYSHEQESVHFEPADEAVFRENEAAWAWFERQPSGYKRAATWWVVSAKRPETRAKRLRELIADSTNQIRVKPLSRPQSK